MIEVASIVYGCHWDRTGHVVGWPLQIQFGAQRYEVTVDEMLEGRGHTVMLIDQLVDLIRATAGTDTPIQLGQGRPPGLARKLIDAGYYVELLPD